MVYRLVRSGHTAQALTSLEVSARRRILGVNFSIGDQTLDPLRASPRFAAIIRWLGLDAVLFTSPNGARPR